MIAANEPIRATMSSPDRLNDVVVMTLEADYGVWECVSARGGCGGTGQYVDHITTLGEAVRHNVTCGQSSKNGWLNLRRATRINSDIGAVVDVIGTDWSCLTCGDGETDTSMAMARGAVHAELCGQPDSEATAARLFADSSVLRSAMSDWVSEQVSAAQLVAEQEAELANRAEEREDAERRLRTDVAAVLVGDADRLRAEVTKPDLKASVLVAAAVGAVVAGGGALGGADLPVAAVGTGAGAVAAAVAAVATLLVAMRPGVSSDPDILVTSDIRDVDGQVAQATRCVQDPDLAALARERAGLQRLASKKFRLVRWAIDGALASIGLAVAGAVTALVGGA